LDPSRDRHDIAQAAAILGISQDGVRKRIKRGQLAAYRVDGRTYVVLDGETDTHDKPNGHETARQDGPDSRQDTTDSRLAPVVARLEDEVRFLRGELERKDTIILAMVQQMRALPAPRDAEDPSSHDANLPRPWWARLAWWRH
jgi:excisionase family DNA binding protein